MARSINPNATRPYILKRERKVIEDLEKRLADKDVDDALRQKLTEELEKANAEKTTWLIGGLPEMLYDQIQDKYIRYGVSSKNPNDAATGIEFSANKRNREVVRYGCRGFENFLDADGKPIVYKPHYYAAWKLNGLDEAQVYLINQQDLLELATEITKDNTLTEQDEKN